MKAWILEQQAQVESKPLSLVEVNTPHPQEDEIRLKVLCCGICRTDIHIIEGDLPLKKSPVILGHEIVGIVDEVGKNVTQFKKGDCASRTGKGATRKSWFNSWRSPIPSQSNRFVEGQKLK